MGSTPRADARGAASGIVFRYKQKNDNHKLNHYGQENRILNQFEI